MDFAIQQSRYDVAAYCHSLKVKYDVASFAKLENAWQALGIATLLHHDMSFAFKHSLVNKLLDSPSQYHSIVLFLQQIQYTTQYSTYLQHSNIAACLHLMDYFKVSKKLPSPTVTSAVQFICDDYRVFEYCTTNFVRENVSVLKEAMRKRPIATCSDLERRKKRYTYLEQTSVMYYANVKRIAAFCDVKILLE